MGKANARPDMTSVAYFTWSMPALMSDTAFAVARSIISDARYPAMLHACWLTTCPGGKTGTGGVTQELTQGRKWVAQLATSPHVAPPSVENWSPHSAVSRISRLTQVPA